MLLNPLLARTQPSPVMEARRWIAGATFPTERPLLNLSQAAPVAPPPPALQEAMTDALRVAETHLYGPVLGLPALREALATATCARYGGQITPDQIAITSGCNQAFCAAITTLAGPGDAVMLPVPWYFNHAMWLSMQGIEAIPLPCDAALLPDLAAARARITPRSRAIVLVTPNNPTGAEYPPALIAGFRDLARAQGLALILDETYRDFHSADGAPHDLFTDPDWDDTVIQLYSFSKAYRLTGHRVGAIVTSAARLAQVEKVLDTVTICPTGLGQRAALFGLTHLDSWLAGERAEIHARRAALEHAFARLQGWQIAGAGAYFGYVRHPFDMPSSALACKLVQDESLLVLPGSMFAPEGDEAAQRHLRIAFANADRAGIATLVARLDAFTATNS
ncbi:MAG: aminotransferase [Roseinatronobacter sp.]